MPLRLARDAKFLRRTEPPTDFSPSPFRESALGLGVAVGVILLFVITLLMVRIKAGPGFFRTLFSRRSKRGRNAKLAKQWPSSHSTDDVASVHSAGNPRTMVLVDKELEILGLVADPRAPLPPAHAPQYESHDRFYQSAPQPSSTTSTLVIPIQAQAQASQSHLKPQLQLQTETCDILPAKRYETPLTPNSPLLPPPPSLWLPLQRPLPTSPKSEHGTGPTRVETEVELYADNMTPLSPSLSHLTFATRSSGVFPCGLEPYAVDDTSGPVADWKSEDTVLVLPSPPRVVRAYGYARA
ncbi:hypothetical protein BJY01DRAFT_68041 [Aspergillus pseudoustus]|uniref:Uncharacterized protein n=1 Tax=Aspergillus pseudoustus TaxID=1810923 RepID=A0ABR4J6N8_9EURO